MATQGQPPFLNHACVATRLLDKRRQMNDVKDLLIVRRAEYERSCEGLRQEEEELEANELKFQQSLFIFPNENEGKQLRAARM